MAVAAAVIGPSTLVQDPAADPIGLLGGQQLLLVLDNCEHVVDDVASAVEQLLVKVPRLHILATSRLPLGLAAEWQYRLPPLDVPREKDANTAAAAMRYPAIQLFVDRASATSSTFELSDANAPFVTDICRRLDGMPLAIELAAARINVLGVRDMALRCEAQLYDGANSRRSAPPRHQTLKAALDWSFRLLSDPEKLLLQRLSSFQGSFSLDSAVRLAARSGLGTQDVLDGIMSLSDKSLLEKDGAGSEARHLLLNTTRAYALEKLRASVDGTPAPG
jgi:predicted ATPase